MIKLYLFPAFFFFSLVLFSCDSNKKIDRSIVEEVTNSHDVKMVSEAEIVTFAMEWGDSISQEAQEALIGTLQKAIKENGVDGAIGFCNVEALPITDSVAKKHGVNIKRVSIQNRNPENHPDENESPLLEAYAYNSENDLENRPNIQKIDNGETLLYTKAIKIPGGLCLNCHGDPEKDISESTLEKIKAYYPNDKAVGYKIGDLRGMWSVRLSKKEVIKNM